MAENPSVLYPASALSCSHHQNIQFCLQPSSVIIIMSAGMLYTPVVWSLVPRLCHIPVNMLGQIVLLKPGKKINTCTLLSFSGSNRGMSSSCMMTWFLEKEILLESFVFFFEQMRFKINKILTQMNTCILLSILPSTFNIYCYTSVTLFGFFWSCVPVSYKVFPPHRSLSLYVD